MEPSITSSPTAIEQPAEQFGIDVELDRHRMPVDAGQHLGEPVALSVGQIGGGGDVGDHLAATGHRELGEVDDRLVGTFAAQQFDRLRQQRRRGAVDARAVSRTLSSNAIRPSAGAV